MSTNVASTQKVSDASPFHSSLARHVYLGRDADKDATNRLGYGHHLDRELGVVYRIDTTTGRIVCRTDLTARPERAPKALETYIRFVADQVGWGDRRKFVGADVFGGLTR